MWRVASIEIGIIKSAIEKAARSIVGSIDKAQNVGFIASRSESGADSRISHAKEKAHVALRTKTDEEAVF